MSVQIRAKDISLTNELKEHINAAIESFRKYDLKISSYNVNIKKEKNKVSVEFELHIAHVQPVVINQSDEDLDTAIDLAIERTTKALRRVHDKLTDYKNMSLKDLDITDE